MKFVGYNHFNIPIYTGTGVPSAISIMTVIHPYSHAIIFIGVKITCNIKIKRSISRRMTSKLFAIYPILRIIIYSIEHYIAFLVCADCCRKMICCTILFLPEGKLHNLRRRWSRKADQHSSRVAGSLYSNHHQGHKKYMNNEQNLSVRIPESLLKSTFESDAETFRVDNRIIKAKRFLFLIILGFTCFLMSQNYIIYNI